MKIGSRWIGALTLLGSVLAALPSVAQTSACALHDQMCIYHGIGRQMGYDPSGPTSITATANWDQPNDADLHALLPSGNTYSTPTEALPGYPLQLSEPFYPDVSGAHIYPNHYESQINGGAATATHSGDAGGGLATYPGQPGCDPSIQSSVTCEAITVQGDVPSGVYSYAIHAFPASGSSFPLTNFTLDVRASGNMVLVSDNPGLQIHPETGLIRQTGSFQGSGATTSQLDVYALNVGHAGHVGGVTIPQMELVSLSDGTQRYQPVEPLLFDETPSIQDQIAGAFMLRDQQVAYYEGLREQEKQRLAYLAELARARAAYNKWLADQEKAQAQQAKMVYMDCPAPLMSCVPSYTKGEKFVLAQPATPAPCNPKYASCVTPPAKFWEPTKSWEQIVSEIRQQSVVMPKNATVSFEEYASQRGIILGNPSDSGAGSLVDGSHKFILPPRVSDNRSLGEKSYSLAKNTYVATAEVGEAIPKYTIGSTISGIEWLANYQLSQFERGLNIARDRAGESQIELDRFKYSEGEWLQPSSPGQQFAMDYTLPGIELVWTAGGIYSAGKTLLRNSDGIANVSTKLDFGVDVSTISKVSEGDVGVFSDLSKRSQKDGLSPDHIPSFASVKASLEKKGIELSDADLRALRSNTNCVVVKTCDHTDFSRTFGGRNTLDTIQVDAEDLRKAADADLDIWEGIWKQQGWSQDRIDSTRREVHEMNKQLFRNIGVPYESN